MSALGCVCLLWGVCVCSGGCVSALGGVCLLWGCLLSGGVSAPRGLLEGGNSFCSRGVSASRRGCGIPACTEVDTPP